MNDDVRIYHVDEYCEGASHFNFRGERKDVVLLEDYEKLRAENEQLKKEVADYHQLQWQHDALIDENERLKNKVAAYEDERKCLIETITCDADVIYRINKENAKLKCLALHAMNDLFFEKQNTASRDGSCALSWEDKAKCDKRCGKYLYWREKCLEAYRKAKKELKEEK